MRDHATTVILIPARREKNPGMQKIELRLPARPTLGRLRRFVPRNDGDIGVAQSPHTAGPANDDRGLDADTRHSPRGYATATSGVNYLWRSGQALTRTRISMAPEVV